MNIQLEDLKKWYGLHKEEVINDYFDFLRFKSISCDPDYKEEVLKTASWLEYYLKEKLGLHVELWTTKGYPVLFASKETSDASAPTVLLYQHYDVQPVDPLELWESDPFEPTIRDGKVYARGALDNKGQCFFVLCALRAFFELSNEQHFNLKIIIEGEEECGSDGTASILEAKKKQLKADYLVVTDLDLPAPNVPGVTLGLRGMISLHVEVENSFVDLHSGTHGGIAMNPNRALATVLAKMWDSKGSIAIPHFYDSVKILNPQELSQIDFSFDMVSYEKNFGITAYCNEEGKQLMESNWLRPSLEINGMWGGYTGSGFKTVIPSKAYAKISCRLVEGQDPEEVGRMIGEFVQNNISKGMKAQFRLDHGGKAVCTSPKSSIVVVAKKAYEEVFKKECKLIYCGASIPIVAELTKVTGSEFIGIGMGLAEDNIHAPNEHFGLDRFEKGFLVVSELLFLLEKQVVEDKRHVPPS